MILWTLIKRKNYAKKYALSISFVVLYVKEKKGCVDCKIKQFKNKYNIRISNCKVIFMAAELLGYNESTAKFIEDQYWDEKNKICSKINCSECYIYDIEHFSPITVSCLEIYIGLILLKDI